MVSTDRDLAEVSAALGEARAFGAREARRRGALALLAASCSFGAAAAAALLHLGALALLPALALGPAQAALVRWWRLSGAERAWPPALHVAVAAAGALLILAIGVASTRTDLIPAAACASLGALLVLQGVRLRDAWAGGLGAAACLAGVGGAWAPPEAGWLVVGALAAIGAASCAVGVARLGGSVGEAPRAGA